MRWIYLFIVILVTDFSSGKLLQLEGNVQLNIKISSYVKALIDDFIARDPSVKGVAIVSLNIFENKKKKVDDLLKDVRQSILLTIAVNSPSLTKAKNCKIRTYPFMIIISDISNNVSDFIYVVMTIL